MSEKVTPESLIVSMQKRYDIPFCEHCEANPDAKKPYMERKEIEVTELTKKITEKLKKETGIPEECLWCIVLSRFFHLSHERQLAELAKYTKG
jgi:hypothetical protein